jgi:hypothetical protein
MPFAPTSNVEVINAWGNDDTFLTKRTRANSTTRYTIEVKSQPILHAFDDTLLGAGPANAVKDLIYSQIKHITEPASRATQKRRQSDYLAFNRGDEEALRKYSGGKIGPMAPNPDSKTMFNNSGRLAESIAVMQNRTDATYTINVAKNRLDPQDFRTTAAFTDMVGNLIRLVPALDPNKVTDYSHVENAIRESIRELITVANTTADVTRAKKLKELAITRKRALIAAGRLVFRGITGRI